MLSIANNENDNYAGPILEREAEYETALKTAVESKDKYEYNKLIQNNPFKKSTGREWVESLFFAVFAAAFIRMFLIEAYVIPTPSMEGSLNVGDFLFVSKAHYGIRTPGTVAMVPLLHNRIPFLNTESYLEKPNIKSTRLPAIETIESGKPIVFNWPVGDSIYLTNKRSYAVMQINQEPGFVQSDPQLASEIRKKHVITRPVDKRDHYIKRCIAVAGDSMEIRNRQVYVNGAPMPNPRHIQFGYIINVPSHVNLNYKKLDEWGIDAGDRMGLNMAPDALGNMYLHLEEGQIEKLKSLDPGITAVIYPHEPEPKKIFPNDPQYFNSWTVDDFGPIWIPKAGETVSISRNNIALYQRIINVYEDNDLKVTEDKIYINGAEANEYTFKQDYYWAMGDNRHNSEDSRMWGFVPHDHIVGKPLFIWFSTKEGNIGNGINWDRIFKSATSKQ
jgi:signal peptidase I